MTEADGARCCWSRNLYENFVTIDKFVSVPKNTVDVAVTDTSRALMPFLQHVTLSYDWIRVQTGHTFTTDETVSFVNHLFDFFDTNIHKNCWQPRLKTKQQNFCAAKYVGDKRMFDSVLNLKYSNSVGPLRSYCGPLTFRQSPVAP